MSPSLKLYLPLALHVIPTIIIGYAIVIPNGPIAGVNDHTIGFAGTLIGTVATYHAGIRLARRCQAPVAAHLPAADQAMLAPPAASPVTSERNPTVKMFGRLSSTAGSPLAIRETHPEGVGHAAVVDEGA